MWDGAKYDPCAACGNPHAIAGCSLCDATLCAPADNCTAEHECPTRAVLKSMDAGEISEAEARKEVDGLMSGMADVILREWKDGDYA